MTTTQTSILPTFQHQHQVAAIQMMREYLDAPKQADGRVPQEREDELDATRVTLIESKLKPLLDRFLRGEVSLSEFKSTNDGINKRSNNWGFRGIKGQMFFNMVVNSSDDLDQCAKAVRAAVAAPSDELTAARQIADFHEYADHVGQQRLANGGTKGERPKLGSVLFFLSYFWQIQQRDVWPVYYTNAVNTLSDLNLWQPSGDLTKDYLVYKRVFERLATLFTESSGQRFGFYEVEHVLWFRGGNPYKPSKASATAIKPEKKP